MKKYDFDTLIDRKPYHSIKYGILEKKFGDKDLFPMWVADMEFPSPDFVIEGIKKRLEHPVLGYSLKPDAYFEAIKNWQAKRNNWHIEKEWIQSSSGVVPSLAYLLMAVTEPNDKVIIQPPVYHPFALTVKSNNRRLLENPLKLVNGKYEMDFDDLRKKIDKDTKALLFCNPHNPVGRVWSEEDLRELGNICVENNIIIISDEIHSDLIHPGHKHIPIASLSKEISMQTITTFAPSKTFNLAGILSSVVVSENPRYRRAYDRLSHQFHFFIDNILGTHALIAAYNQGENWLKQVMSYIHDNYLFAKEFFNKNMPEVEVHDLEGTYLLWLDYNKIFETEEQLQNYFLKKAKVAPNFGIDFGENGKGFARINLAAPRKFIEEGLNKLLNNYPLK